MVSRKRIATRRLVPKPETTVVEMEENVVDLTTPPEEKPIDLSMPSMENSIDVTVSLTNEEKLIAILKANLARAENSIFASNMIVNNLGVCGEKEMEMTTNSVFLEDLSYTDKNVQNIESTSMPMTIHSALPKTNALQKNSVVDVGIVAQSGDGCNHSQVAFETPLELTHSAASIDAMPVSSMFNVAHDYTTSVACSANVDAVAASSLPINYGHNFVTPKIETNNDFIASTSRITSTQYSTNEPLVMPIEFYQDGDTVMPSFDMANFEIKMI